MVEDTLDTWCKKNFTEIVLDDTPIVTIDSKTGGAVTRKPSRVNLELTSALLSCSNITEFARVVFHLAPVGIVVTPIDPDFYHDMLLLLRAKLTRVLLQQGSNKSVCERYLAILERRDAENWARIKDIKVASSQQGGTTALNINFVTV